MAALENFIICIKANQHITNISETEGNTLYFELICLEIKILPLFHIILISKIHFWNKLGVKRSFSAQMSWPWSFKIAQEP